MKYLSSVCASVSFAAAARSSADGISGPSILYQNMKKGHVRLKLSSNTLTTSGTIYAYSTSMSQGSNPTLHCYYLASYFQKMIETNLESI